MEKIRGRPARDRSARPRGATTKAARGGTKPKSDGAEASAPVPLLPKPAPEVAHQTSSKRARLLIEPPHTPPADLRGMQLHWGDTERPEPPGGLAEAPAGNRLIERWVERGATLLREIEKLGAAGHEVRADLRERRFAWLGPDGRASVEAQAEVLCGWSKSTKALTMAWADPVVRGASVPRIDWMPAERDGIDEEAAWRLAMEAAEACGAEYLYRTASASGWYFLALGKLSASPAGPAVIPSNPAGLVLKNLDDARSAIESRAEPREVVRERLQGLGDALLHEAGYAYRGTDWVARLERTGRRLLALARGLPGESFRSVAAGRGAGEWLDRDSTVELSRSLSLLEDEWTLFA